MLGNDVVDLRDADSRPESFRPRFDTRVFTAEERRAISRDRDPLARRWAHWAAKEAAFKLTKQIDPEFIFSPSRLAVQFDALSSEATRKVERSGFVQGLGPSANSLPRVEVRSIETEEWVHVVALSVGGDWGAVDLVVAPLESILEDPGSAARKLAVREVSRSLGIAPDRLAIGRRGAATSGWQGGAPRGPLGGHDIGRRRIPTIELDGAPTSLSLSLSHHGRFIGYAMTPRLETSVEVGRQRDSKATLVGTGAVIH